MFGLSAQAKAQLIAKLSSASSIRPAERSPRHSDPGQGNALPRGSTCRSLKGSGKSE